MNPDKPSICLSDESLDDLQRDLALADLILSPSLPDGTVTLCVWKCEHVKVRLRPDRNHLRPHFHIEYKQEYKASYSIHPIEKLAGNMPSQHEQKIMDWCKANKDPLLATYKALKSGKDVRELVIERQKT